MQLIGVTGGIGSGKSFVCRQLEHLGYPCYYADDRAKELMVQDADLRHGLLALFGPEAYLTGGELNRAYLGEQIFQHPELRSQMNALVHPAVARDTLAWVEAHRAASKRPFLLREAAILFESGSAASCDGVVTVYAPLQVRLERVMRRDKREEAEVRKRMAAQWPEQEKILAADFVVYNDGTHTLIPQLAALIRWATSL